MEIIESITEKLRFFKSAKLPLIRQKEQSDCAIACMAMIARYYGQSITLRSMDNELVTNEKGMSVREIIKCAEKLNLKGKVRKITTKQLKSINLPVILHWNGNHFVILKSVHDNGVYLHDPAIGKTFVSWQEIYNQFTGIVIHLTPNEIDASKTIFTSPSPSRNKLTVFIK
jgi:ATP-binding cassette subfamily B protein RaxB